VEEVKHFGGVDFQLINEDPGEGEGDFEGGRWGIRVADARVKKVVAETKKRDVSGFCDPSEQGRIEFGVKVRRVGIKDSVFAEAEGLVEMKIEQDSRHAGNYGSAAEKLKRKKDETGVRF
jgi:hypothetical protein